MWLCVRKVRNFVPWLHHEPKESVCFKIPNVLSQVLNAILTKSGKSYQSRQSHFHKNMSPVNQGMGGGALKGALSGVGCAAQTLPLKYLNRFTLLPCLETSVSENISSVSLWFLVSIEFFCSLQVTPPMWTPRHKAMTAHTCLIGFKVHLPVCLPIERWQQV